MNPEDIWLGWIVGRRMAMLELFGKQRVSRRDYARHGFQIAEQLEALPEKWYKK